MKYTLRTITFICVSLMFISCGSNSVLTSFSKRKYLPKFPKKKIVEKPIEPTKDIILSASLTEDIDYLEIENQFIENVKEKIDIDNQYHDFQLSNNFKEEPLSIASQHYNINNESFYKKKIIRVDEELNKKKSKKVVNILVGIIGGLFLIGTIFLLIDRLTTSAYISQVYLIGWASLIIAFILLIVLILVLIVLSIIG